MIDVETINQLLDQYWGLLLIIGIGAFILYAVLKNVDPEYLIGYGGTALILLFIMAVIIIIAMLLGAPWWAAVLMALGVIILLHLIFAML